jgi:hypothetical protein
LWPGAVPVLTDRPDYDDSGDGPAKGLLGDVTDRRGSQNGTAAGYSPAYYLVPAALERLPGTIDERLSYMRLWSVALGAATVWLSYRIGLRLFPHHHGAAVLLAVSVALQPMLAQQTAVLNNDAGLVAAGALCTLLALQLTDRRRVPEWAGGEERRRVRSFPVPWWAGVAAGLAMLAKPTGVAWLAVLAVAWLVGRRRHGSWPSWWREIAQAGAGLACTYGLWAVYARLGHYPGVGYGTASTPERGLGALLRETSRSHFFVLRANWVDEFWGSFSYLTVPLPRWVQPVLLLATLVGMVLFVAWAFRAVRDVAALRATPGPWTGTPALRQPGGVDLAAHTTICVIAVAATVSGLLFLMAQYFHQYGRFDLIQGRYALMILPALLALPSLFLRRLAPRLSPAVPLAVMAAGLFALHVLSLAVVVDAFYV